MDSKKPKPPPDPKILLQKAKPKPRISVGAAKRILCSKTSDKVAAFWVENYIDNLVRGNNYPPQLVSDEFQSLLTKFFDAEKSLQILNDLRMAYHCVPTQKEDFAWLLPILCADKAVVDALPPNFLTEV